MAIAPQDQWYVVHVLSGLEQKVQENLNRRIKLEEMSDYVYEVLIPTERVQEIKRGKKTETTRKFFPGYLIVNMNPDARQQLPLKYESDLAAKSDESDRSARQDAGKRPHE